MRSTISFSLALCLSVLAFGQDAPPPQGQGDGRGQGMRGQFRNMPHVTGTVVSVSGDEMVVKPESGDNVTVKVSSDARVRKDRQEAKLSDLKAGDHVMVGGEQGSDKVFKARFVAVGEMGRMGMMGAPPSPEEMVKMGLGTTFIAGEVKSIEETKLTIARPDGQTQVIEADENTSFKNGKNESVTLADIKVGDHVMGRGEVKNGVFVPSTLRVGMPQGFGRGRGPGAPDGPPQGPPPSSEQTPQSQPQK